MQSSTIFFPPPRQNPAGQLRVLTGKQTKAHRAYLLVPMICLTSSFWIIYLENTVTSVSYVLSTNFYAHKVAHRDAQNRCRLLRSIGKFVVGSAAGAVRKCNFHLLGAMRLSVS